MLNNQSITDRVWETLSPKRIFPIAIDEVLNRIIHPIWNPRLQVQLSYIM